MGGWLYSHRQLTTCTDTHLCIILYTRGCVLEYIVQRVSPRSVSRHGPRVGFDYGCDKGCGGKRRGLLRNVLVRVLPSVSHSKVPWTSASVCGVAMSLVSQGLVMHKKHRLGMQSVGTHKYDAIARICLDTSF